MSLKFKIIESGQKIKKMILQGQLDTNTAPSMEKKLMELISSSHHHVLVIDVLNLTYLSSAGLRVLFKIQKTLESNHGQLFIVNPQPAIQKVFSLINVAKFMNIYNSNEEMNDALKSYFKPS